jgi:hypothetical protein
LFEIVYAVNYTVQCLPGDALLVQFLLLDFTPGFAAHSPASAQLSQNALLS